MSGTKLAGVILLVLAVPLAVLGLMYLFSDVDVPDLVPGDRGLSGYAAAGAGALLLLVGVVLMVVGRKPHAAAAPQSAVATEQYEIKRTEMNWGARPTAVPEDLQAQLDAVNHKLSRIKVQYGMGELSSESYKTLTQQYEQEKAVIERKVIEQQGL